MGAHWDWLFTLALRTTDATHFLVLTDRMLFRPGGLRAVLQLVQRYPLDAITYNHARVNDYSLPCSITEWPWTGTALFVPSRSLLDLAARCNNHPSLPRLLNSVIPRHVASTVRAAFGSYCLSQSPDFCFAFRCLDLLERICYYDAQPLIGRALDRSNGAGFTRGVLSADNADFVATNQDLQSEAPEPRFHTVENAVAHEYCLVRRSHTRSRLPKLETSAYILANAQALDRLIDPDAQARLASLLTEHGWAAAAEPTLHRKGSGFHQRIAEFSALSGRERARWLVARAAKRTSWLLAHPMTKGLWPLLTMTFGFKPVTVERFRFKTSEEAVAFLERCGRRPTLERSHLAELVADTGQQAHPGRSE